MVQTYLAVADVPSQPPETEKTMWFETIFGCGFAVGVGVGAVDEQPASRQAQRRAMVYFIKSKRGRECSYICGYSN